MRYRTRVVRGSTQNHLSACSLAGRRFIRSISTLAIANKVIPKSHTANTAHLNMSSAETTEFDLGCRVRVVGLVQAAHHNGKTGVVVASLDTETGRIGVELEDGAKVRIKPGNMQQLLHPDDAAFRADSSRPAQPLQASAAPPEAAAADGESAIVDFLMKQ